MDLTVSWGDAKKSHIRFTSDGSWTRAPLTAAVAEILHLLNSSALSVHIMIELQAARVTTSEFIGSAQYLKTLIQHPKTRHILVIGASAETESLCKSYPAFNHFHFANTLDEGYTLLSQLDYLSSVGGLQIASS